MLTIKFVFLISSHRYDSLMMLIPLLWGDKKNYTRHKDFANSIFCTELNWFVEYYLIFFKQF